MPEFQSGSTGGRFEMTVVYAAIVCGVLAVIYGIVTSGRVLAAPAGNPRMVEIAGAIQTTLKSDKDW